MPEDPEEAGAELPESLDDEEAAAADSLDDEVAAEDLRDELELCLVPTAMTEA